MAFRLRFTEGFSKCCRLRSSVRIPDFSTLRLKRRRAFSKLSSSRTCTTGIQLTSFLLGNARPRRGEPRANILRDPGRGVKAGSVGGVCRPRRRSLRRTLRVAELSALDPALYLQL